MMVAASVVVAVLYSREFHSEALHAMRETGFLH